MNGNLMKGNPMNGNKLQQTIGLHDTLNAASTAVLETMFFTEAEALTELRPHQDALSCLLHCSGAEQGTFSVAIDRAALLTLCESFYGETPTAAQPFELLCEFTNMIAGSTLSLYSPDHFCPLSSPQLCDIAIHLADAAQPGCIFLSYAVEEGTLSIVCSLRAK
jgi:hypothetical protein